jgi:hypothetical protein
MSRPGDAAERPKVTSPAGPETLDLGVNLTELAEGQARLAQEQALTLVKVTELAQEQAGTRFQVTELAGLVTKLISAVSSMQMQHAEVDKLSSALHEQDSLRQANSTLVQQNGTLVQQNSALTQELGALNMKVQELQTRAARLEKPVEAGRKFEETVHTFLCGKYGQENVAYVGNNAHSGDFVVTVGDLKILVEAKSGDFASAHISKAALDAHGTSADYAIVCYANFTDKAAAGEEGGDSKKVLKHGDSTRYEFEPVVGTYPAHANADTSWMAFFSKDKIAVCTLYTMPFALLSVLKVDASAQTTALLEFTGATLTHLRHLTTSPSWDLLYTLLFNTNGMHLYMSDINTFFASYQGHKADPASADPVPGPVLAALNLGELHEKFKAYVHKTLSADQTKPLRKRGDRNKQIALDYCK